MTSFCYHVLLVGVITYIRNRTGNEFIIYKLSDNSNELSRYILLSQFSGYLFCSQWYSFRQYS